MRPPEEVKKQIVMEWLRKAENDMAVAQRLVGDEAIFSNAVAFHCQQAAEKYIKAFLVWHEIVFPKTHDLEELVIHLAPTDERLAAQLQEAAVLTPYGAELRYPGDRAEAMPRDAREAVRLAAMVRDAVVPLLPVSP